MFEFGETTNSLREQLAQQEIVGQSANLVTDDLKNHFQFSEATILAEREILESENNANDKEYLVMLIREKREIIATHKTDHSWWKITSFPKPGDRVRIKHKKDLFQAEIIEVLSSTYADAIAKYGRITKKAG